MFKYFVKHAYVTYFADGDSFNIKVEEQKIEITRKHAFKIVNKEDDLLKLESDASYYTAWGFTTVGCAYMPLDSKFGFREGEDELVVEHRQPEYVYVTTFFDGDSRAISKAEMIAAIGEKLTDWLESAPNGGRLVMLACEGENWEYTVKERE